jgi:hypothetical protein
MVDAALDYTARRQVCSVCRERVFAIPDLIPQDPLARVKIPETCG